MVVKWANQERGREEMVVKWVKHYSSMHRILLVGEGDFSFALCLANAFGSPSNIVATSLDSHDTVVKMYDKAKENLENLKKLGVMIIHEIDASFIGKEDNVLVIYQHRQLVNGFFKSAGLMLQPFGEVHVSHKIGDPYHKWNLEELASNNSLVLTECVNFDINDYPGYSNKRGAEPRCSEPFPLRKCRTFKFQIANPRKRKHAMESLPGFGFITSFFETWVDNSCYSEGFGSSHLPVTPVYPQEGIVSTLQWSPGCGIPNVFMSRPCGYSNLEELLRSLSRDEWRRYLISKHGFTRHVVIILFSRFFLFSKMKTSYTERNPCRRFGCCVNNACNDKVWTWLDKQKVPAYVNDSLNILMDKYSELANEFETVKRKSEVDSSSNSQQRQHGPCDECIVLRLRCKDLETQLVERKKPIQENSFLAWIVIALLLSILLVLIYK